MGQLIKPPVWHRELTEDHRLLLAAFAASQEPIAQYEAFWIINPKPAVKDHRRREWRAWHTRNAPLWEVALDLREWGLVDEVIPPQGEDPWKCEITAAGRVALAAVSRD